METFIWEGVCVAGTGVLVAGTGVLVLPAGVLLGMGMAVSVGIGIPVPVGMGVPPAQGSLTMVMLGMASIMSCMSEQGIMGAAGAGKGLSTRLMLRSPPDTTVAESLEPRRASVFVPACSAESASGMCSVCHDVVGCPSGLL
jgi:hypothetical protein